MHIHRLKPGFTLIWGTLSADSKMRSCIERSDIHDHIFVRRIEIMRCLYEKHSVTLSVCDKDWKDLPETQLEHVRASLAKWATHFKLRPMRAHRVLKWGFSTPVKKDHLLYYTFRMGLRLTEALGISEPSWVGNPEIKTVWLAKKGAQWRLAQRVLFEDHLKKKH